MTELQPRTNPEQAGTDTDTDIETLANQVEELQKTYSREVILAAAAVSERLPLMGLDKDKKLVSKEAPREEIIIALGRFIAKQG